MSMRSPASSEAGSDRVDAPVLGEHRDLRARPGIAGGGLDLEQPVLELRHLQLEQVHDELGGGAREHELRAAARAVHLPHVGAHAVPDAEVLLGNHLVARQHRLEPA
jgi:hypothetical protein